MSLQRLAFPIARRFVAGEDVADALAAVRRINAAGMTATIDLLGEDVRNAAGADRVRDAYLALVERVGSSDADTNLSLKLSALGLTFDRDATLARLAAVLDAAQRAMRDPFVRVDMEGSALTAATLDVVTSAFATRANTGAVLQAYLHRTPHDVAQAIALAMRVRLCKGAYREPPEIAYQAADEIRVRFLALATQLLARGTYPAIATHDRLLIDAVRTIAREREIDAGSFEFQLLFGVRPDVQRALVDAGYRVRIYVPFGTHWAKYFRRRVTERRENLVFALRSLVARP